MRPTHDPLASRRARELRAKLTPAEKRLWAHIRGGATGARFRRQAPIGRWIADFMSLEPRIVIEVDDRSHETRDESERTAYIEERGFTIVRVTNRDVALDIDAVIDLITNHVDHLSG